LPPGAGRIRPRPPGDRGRVQADGDLAPLRAPARGVRAGAAPVRGSYLALLAAVTVMGCQEKLTAPADCPALCPGGSSQVFDEVISPITGADSSFRGYTQPYSSSSLLVSN